MFIPFWAWELIFDFSVHHVNDSGEDDNLVFLEQIKYFVEQCFTNWQFFVGFVIIIEVKEKSGSVVDENGDISFKTEE